MAESAWILTFVGVVVSYLKMRHAWRWWSNRQQMRLHQEAETIRDRLLQESFTMRRRLENSLIDAPNASMQDCLEQLNTFHQTLNALSDRLSPPYVQDDFSLAIAHLFKTWESDHPTVSIRYHAPPDWTVSAHESDPSILEAIDELLRIIVPKLLTPKIIFVTLNNDHGQLAIDIRIPDTQNLDIHADLKHLARSLRFLAGGHCSFSYQQHTIDWHYRQQRAFVEPTCKD